MPLANYQYSLVSVATLASLFRSDGPSEVNSLFVFSGLNSEVTFGRRKLSRLFISLAFQVVILIVASNKLNFSNLCAKLLRFLWLQTVLHSSIHFPVFCNCRPFQTWFLQESSASQMMKIHRRYYNWDANLFIQRFTMRRSDDSFMREYFSSNWDGKYMKIAVNFVGWSL